MPDLDISRTRVAPGSELYACSAAGDLESLNGDGDPGPAGCAAHAALRAFVEHSDYPCVGAKAALSRKSYVLGLYAALGSAEAAVRSADDLAWFAANAGSLDDSYATFLAVFRGLEVRDDAHFEALLWEHLAGMHRHDSRSFDWDHRVSDDPGSPEFRFSIGGSAFFVIGMHPNAGREARRFPFPMLVFNPHAQFEALRRKGRFERMRSVIRTREASLEGEANPVLKDHGERSEACQYAGRAHEPGWTPAFRASGLADTFTRDGTKREGGVGPC